MNKTEEQLREKVEAILVELIQLPRGKTITQSDYTDEVMALIQADRQRLLGELLDYKKPLQPAYGESNIKGDKWYAQGVRDTDDAIRAAITAAIKEEK